jgi:hypothetical protein
MASEVGKERILMWYREWNPVVTVQRRFHREFDGKP